MLQNPITAIIENKSFLNKLLSNPYNGNQIGQFTGDAIRNITGNTGSTFYRGGRPANSAGVLYASEYGGAGVETNITTENGNPTISFDASRLVPTARENRPVSVSVLICISYCSFRLLEILIANTNKS